MFGLFYDRYDVFCWKFFALHGQALPERNY